MPRIRDPNRDKAYEIYKSHSGNIDLVEIANQLSVPQGTVRGWKAKDKWNDKLNGTEHNTERSEQQKGAPKEQSVKAEIEQLDNSKLTDKQKLFCIYYVKYFNVVKAALKAGYSESYANARAYELLDNVGLKEEIQRLKRNKLGRAMLSEDDIFQKYLDIAFADMNDYVDFGNKEIEIDKKEDGEPVMLTVSYVDLKDSNTVDGTLISEVKKGKDGVSVKLHDKMKAMQWLADRMDLLPKETQIRLENEQQRLDLAKQKATNQDGKQEKDVAEALRGLVNAINSETD